MNSMQLIVSKFNLKKQINIETHLRILDLASEVGEVCKLAFSKGVGKNVEKKLWEEELGDVLYSLISLMSELEIDSEKALLKVIEKYQSRIAQSNSMSSGS